MKQRYMKQRFVGIAFVLSLAAASSAQAELPFTVQPVAQFDEPWALSFLPDGRLLVTEKKGNLFIVGRDGVKSRPIAGVPHVAYGGQGGLGDVLPHPDFNDNRTIYLSFAEAGVGDTRGAAVARAVLDESARRPRLTDVEIIWRQYPKLLSYGHYGHRLAFGPDNHLWISSGEREKFTPAQDMQSTAGKIVRLHDDGSIPADNPFVDYLADDPFVDDAGVYDQIWSLGHRNPLGLAFDLTDRLWVIEMGPAGGDELNLVRRGANYGYPTVSNGEHYDGRPIPDHDSRPGFEAPVLWWTPVISPADMIVYRGDLFPDWQGHALVAGLSARGIVRIGIDGESAREIERYDLGARFRALTEADDGSLWVLEDDRDGSTGRLLKLTP